MEILYRNATLDRKAVDEKNRTAVIAFSSEEPVERGSYREILSHSRGDYDFSRINQGGALLLNHDTAQQIGVVDSAEVQTDPDGRKVGRAVVRFGKGQLASEVFQDVCDGIRRGVSFGYEQTRVVSRTKGSGNTDEIRYAFKPFELSLVSVPADVSVGVGRAQVTQEPRNTMNKETPSEARELADITEGMVRKFPYAEADLNHLYARCVCGELKMDQFQKEAWSLISRNKPNPTMTPVHGNEAGMSQRDIGQYSLRRAIANASENGGTLRSSYEADVSQQVATNTKKHAEGFFIPTEVVLGSSRRDYQQRDLSVGTFNQGGAFVQTNVPTSIIDLLRNRTVCIRLGATMLAGLEGNVSIPRETAATQAYSLPETGLVTDGNPTIDQVSLVPHRVSASVKFSRQLLLQSSVDAENFVRDDAMKSVGIKHDALAIYGGNNGDEPTGIINTPGIGSLTFGGAATWQSVVAFETALGLYNADRGRMAYVAPPSVRGRWKDIAKVLQGATTVASIPLWEPGAFAPTDDAVDGIVNGYRGTSTNQMASGQVLFGNFQELIIAMWGGFDVVVDPYTLATTAQIRVTINTFIDTALRHPQSFCVSADSGAQ